MTSIGCRSNSGKERAGASWKLEILLLTEDPPGLPEAKPATSPEAESVCDSGPTLSLQGWDCQSSALSAGVSAVLPGAVCWLRTRPGTGAGPAQPLSPGWDGEQPVLPGSELMPCPVPFAAFSEPCPTAPGV